MIILKAKFESVKKLSTKTNLVFSTQDEIDRLEEIQLLKADGYLAFNPDEFRMKVLEIIKNKRIGVSQDGMTKSQVLRNVLFQIHDGVNDGTSFEEFYSSQMDRIIQHYKEKYL